MFCPMCQAFIQHLREYQVAKPSGNGIEADQRAGQAHMTGKTRALKRMSAASRIREKLRAWELRVAQVYMLHARDPVQT